MKRPTLLEVGEWIFASVAALGGLTALKNAWGLLAIPYQLNFEEGVILNATERLIAGQALYPRSHEFPVIIHQYGPVYYYLGAWLLKWMGTTFAPLRLMTLVSAMVIAGLLALLLHQLTGSWKLALSFGFLFLTVPLVQDWLALARVDMPGVALTLAGLYLYCRFRDHWYLAIPFFLAAIFCKYTLIAAPGACFLEMLLQKRLKQAAEFAGTLALLGGAVFLGFQRATGGGLMFDTLGSHADPLNFWRALHFVQIAVLQSPFLVVLGLGLAVRDLRTGVATLPSLYLGLSTLSLISAEKLGSDSNHMLEWTAILCLCAGLCCQALREQAADAAALLLVPAALALTVLVTLRPPLVYSDHAGCAQAYAYVKNHPGRRVLSENVGAVVMAGKPVELSDPFVWTWLVRREGWSDAELQGLIRAHAFDLVILNGPIDWQKSIGEMARWPLPVLDALQQNYRPTVGFACQDARIAYEPIGVAPP